MKGTRSDIELCEALSGFFVDNEVDYRYIAKVAKAFPIEHVEKVLFEWVAPVCYTNMLTPVIFGAALKGIGFGLISRPC